jgi:hypothetical protein
MLVYDSKELTGVTTTRLRMIGVLQLVLESTIAVSQTYMSQLRRIR